jgi:hypothetical protein
VASLARAKAPDGTAINKLLFAEPLRYSEDIDFVQIRPEPIGKMVDAIRRALSWLGPCRRKSATHPWFSGKVTIASFEAEELFGTKLRALLQRWKGRDLFDLNEGLKQLSLDAPKVIAAFNHYLAHEGTPISRANAEERMLDKLTRSLTDDIKPMLATDVVYGDDNALEAFERVWFGLIAGLHGEAWHKSEEESGHAHFRAAQPIRQSALPRLSPALPARRPID